MNIHTTMDALYVVKARFDSLAKQLEQAGHHMAAEELKREAHHFGCQLTQLDGVIDDYQIDIAAVQRAEQPRFIGVDMAKPGDDHTCFKGMNA